MSWATDWFRKRKTTAQVVGLSTVYLQQKLGVTVSDKNVDDATKAAVKLGDDLETLVKAYVSARIPGLGAAVAAIAVTAAFNVIDAAIAGAAETVKANN